LVNFITHHTDKIHITLCAISRKDALEFESHIRLKSFSYLYR
jgi:hypothetical protein